MSNGLNFYKVLQILYFLSLPFWKGGGLLFQIYGKSLEIDILEFGLKPIAIKKSPFFPRPLSQICRSRITYLIFEKFMTTVSCPEIVLTLTLTLGKGVQICLSPL